MGIKEERERMWSGKSPLRNHSMKKSDIRRSLHGERIMRRIIEAEEEKPARELVIDKESLASLLPVTEQFQNKCLDFMIDLSIERSIHPDDDQTIPTRAANLLVDVEKTYRYSRERGVCEVIIDRPVLDVAFPMRDQFLRHPGLLQRNSLLVAFNRIPGWRHATSLGPLSEGMKVDIFQKFFKAFEINLDSCDFGLEDEELVQERVETNAYLLASLSTLGDLMYKGVYNSDQVFYQILDHVRKGLRNKRR